MPSANDVGFANDVRYANDAWLRHILRQTSHHCGTQWSNIILSEARTSLPLTAQMNDVTALP
ncbi:MAG: hypothetical protein II365_04770 [Clostridia bacterium]|nr:hypothetical protein [Clostridia bacterium]